MEEERLGAQALRPRAAAVKEVAQQHKARVQAVEEERDEARTALAAAEERATAAVNELAQQHRARVQAVEEERDEARRLWWRRRSARPLR